MSAKKVISTEILQEINLKLRESAINFTIEIINLLNECVSPNSLYYNFLNYFILLEFIFIIILKNNLCDELYTGRNHQYHNFEFNKILCIKNAGIIDSKW